MRRALQLVGRLFERRLRRRWWLWVIVLVLYVPAGLMTMHDVLGNTPLGNALFFMPIVLIAVQLVWPTVLVWTLLSVPAMLYLVWGLADVVLRPEVYVSGGPIREVLLTLLACGLIAYATWPPRIVKNEGALATLPSCRAPEQALPAGGDKV